MSEIERTSPNSARATAVYDREPRDLLDAAGRAMERLSRWRLTEREEGTIRAVRTTSLFHFKDDVQIQAEPDGDHYGQSRLILTSSSRVGKGDLGQNPRNLHELLDAIERGLDQT